MALLVLAWRKSDLVNLIELPSWEVSALAILLFTCTWRLGGGRWRGGRGLISLPSRPPLEVGGLFGGGIAVVALAYSESLRVSLGLNDEGRLAFRAIGLLLLGATVIFVVVAATFLAAAAASARLRPSITKARPALAVPPLKSLSLDFETLRQWTAHDQPAGSSPDLFGHARIAQRIALRLSEEMPPAQAVVGRLGAGKTNLRHLVQRALEELGTSRHVRLVPVELWPYETSKAAVEGVINGLVDAISAEVSSLSLRGISASYAEAMSSAGGWWSVLVRMQGVPSKPLVALRAIDAIAKTIGLRYIVWIEDLERFAGNEETSSDRLSPIRALLYGLDQLAAITVVTATTTLRMRFDLEKIARYVEELPEIRPNHVDQILKRFREGCLKQRPFIDPALPASRKQLDELGYPTDNLGALAQAMMGPGVHDIKQALPVLCSTPRTLKQALRSCLDKWETLIGELDFDDLFVLSLLKEAQPDAFAVIQDHLPHLRGYRSYSDERNKEREKEWQAALARVTSSEVMRSAVEHTVQFLFDKQRSEAHPQSVRHSNHADYWERFLSVPCLEEAERDQFILRAIASGEDERMLRLLENPNGASAVEDFANAVPTAQLKRLFLPLVARRAVEDPQTWTDDPPGLFPLWRMWLRSLGRNELSKDDVWEQLQRAYDIALPTNLSLLALLEEYFCGSEGGSGPELLDTHRRMEARRHLRQGLVSTYRTNPHGLVSALRGAKIQALLWVVWGLDQVRNGPMTGSPFPGWPNLASVVLDAARLAPKVVLPQLAGLVLRTSTMLDDVHGISYEFDPERASNLFGDVEAVLDVYRREAGADWVGVRHVEAVLSAASATRAVVDT